MGYGTNIGTSEEKVGQDIDKILFKFSYDAGTRHSSKIYRAVGSLKDSASFEKSLASHTSGTFTSLAGCDLSAIFYPYRIASGVVDTMPTILSTEYNQSIMPYQVDFSLQNKVFNRLIGPSGDMMGAAVSSDYYLGDSEILRDADDVRSVGFRLPAMGVGWGKSVTGAPVPSDPDGSGLYVNYLEDGTSVDPKDYIAAPIDFRYDENRGVWTCSREETAFARITKTVASSGYYEAEQVVFNTQTKQWLLPTADHLLYPSGWTEEPGNPNGVIWEIGQFSSRPTETIIEVSNSQAASGSFWWFENDDNEFWAEIISSWAEDPDISTSDPYYVYASGITTVGTNLKEQKWIYNTFPPATASDQYRQKMFGTYTLRRVESYGSGVYSVPDPASGTYLEFEAKNLDEIEFPNIWSDSNPDQNADSVDFRGSFWIPASGQYVRVQKIKRSNDPLNNRDYSYVFKYPIRFNDSIRTDGIIYESVQHFGYTDKDDDVVTANSFSHIFGQPGSQFPMRSLGHRKKLYTTPDNDDPFWQIGQDDDIDFQLGVGWLNTQDQNITVHPQSGSYGAVTARIPLIDAETSGLKSYRVTWDDRGHLDTIIGEDVELSGVFTDQLVAVESGKVPGFLNDVLDTPNDWLNKTINADVLEITHEDPQAAAAARDMDFDVAENAGTITWTYYDGIEFDNKGHHRDSEVQRTFTLDVLAASDPWLEIAAAAGGGGATIAHTGPDVEANTKYGVSNLAANDAQTVGITSSQFSFDSKGHYRSAGGIASGLSIQFESTDGTIDTIVTDDGPGAVIVDQEIDLSAITGWSNTKVQVLVNNQGTLEWRDTEECP